MYLSITHTYLSKYVKTSNEDKYHREQRAALENGYRNGATHSFRMRCLMVLGKADGLSNAAAGARGGQTYQRVMHWVKRFQSEGMAGLKNKSGNGRKRIISTKEDMEAVREAIRQHRQSVFKARAAWEEATGKKIKDGAFRNFLSSMAQDLDV